MSHPFDPTCGDCRDPATNAKPVLARCAAEVNEDTGIPCGACGLAYCAACWPKHDQVSGASSSECRAEITESEVRS